MTDEERELREWCNRQLEFPGVAPLVILAALDVDKVKWKMGFESIGSDPLGHGDVALAYRNAIIHAMHAAIFGEKAK